MLTIQNKGVVETTKEKNYMRVEAYGLSTDSKPTQAGNYYIGNGSLFIEMDTGKIYFYDLANTRWLEFGVEAEPVVSNEETQGNE